MSDRPRNINDLLDKLTNVKPAGQNKWTADCLVPGHKTPAGHLTITEAGDKALVTCQGGRHSYQDICQALGLDSLTYSRNGDSPESNKQKTLVTTFSYEYEKDKEAYQIRRFDLGNGNKTFEAWNKREGQYVSGMGEYKGKPILYHLPEIPEWIAAGKRIYIPEGELKADRIISKGGAATTSPFGAGRNKWRTEYSKALAGAEVIVLPDNDKPGRDFAQDKAASLYGIAKSVKVLELPGLPEKGDIIDWFNAGGTFEQLEQLASETPENKSGEPVDLAALLSDVRGMITRYVVLGTQQANAVTLWVAHTHTVAAAEVTPYIAISSAEKRSGKTRLLEVLDLLVAHPWLTGRTTAAALARKVDRDCPTLLLDESDAAFAGDKEYAETLRSVLNTGHRRGGKVTCCVGQGANLDFRDFSTFCPKAIAGIGKLPDTVSDRSIAVILKRRAPSEPVKRFRYRDAALEAAPLRESLTRWASQAIPALGNARPDIPTTLGDRAADGWEPLLAVADIAGGGWPERGRRAALALSVNDVHEDESVGVRLLADVRTVFEEKGEDRLSTSVLLEHLTAMEEAPWGDWYNKPLTARGLAKLLKPFGIVPHTIRTDAGTLKGYAEREFHDAWSRYTPPLSVTTSQVEIERKETSQGTLDGRIVTDVTDNVSAMGPGHFEANVTDVTDRQAKTQRNGIVDRLTPLTDGDSPPHTLPVEPSSPATNATEKEDEKPVFTCGCCGSHEFWLRGESMERICNVCHPSPF